jgi:hypothetical protein
MASRCKTRLEDSRKSVFPPFVDLPEFKIPMIKQWTDTLINQDIVNSHQQNKIMPTLPVPVVKKAGDILLSQLTFLGKKEISILEIMAGNCSGSQIILKSIKHDLDVKKWIASDIIDFTKNIKEPLITFVKSDGLSAVKKYGNDSDILLLMCPPPNAVMHTASHVNPRSLCDYYSIVEFTESNAKKGKLIIIIGELGASDATEGMYHFMMTNKKVELVYREMLLKSENDYGPIEKEIFIFSVL